MWIIWIRELRELIESEGARNIQVIRVFSMDTTYDEESEEEHRVSNNNKRHKKLYKSVSRLKVADKGWRKCIFISTKNKNLYQILYMLSNSNNSRT